MNALPTDTLKVTLDEWSTALTKAFAAAGFGVTFHPNRGSGHRIGEMHVTPKTDNDTRYKIEFERKLIVKGSERILLTGVEVYNPTGGLHVHMKGFSPEKVVKIVEYATKYITDRIANEQRIEAKRKRANAARKVWEDSRVELPDWITALANTDTDEDLGTFYMVFHEHRASYALKRLTPAQIGKIAAYVQTVINEPTT